MEVWHCRWETWQRAPYFANLKVMRSVLQTLRRELTAPGGSLRAYVFLEDRVAFLVEGRPELLRGALESARARSEAAFAASNRKHLWGASSDLEVTGLARDRVLASLRQMPADAGLAADLSAYPWAGGDWLFPAA
jgi:hypothetical protein